MSELTQLRNKVNSMTQGIFKDSMLTEDGKLLISFQSTVLLVDVTASTDIYQKFAKDFELSKTYVDIRAIVLQDVKPTPELSKYVAEFSPTALFPGVSIYLSESENNKVNVIASTVISADDLDPSELRTALINVGISADLLDDDMQQQFGGKRASD